MVHQCLPLSDLVTAGVVIKVAQQGGICPKTARAQEDKAAPEESLELEVPGDPLDKVLLRLEELEAKLQMQGGDYPKIAGGNSYTTPGNPFSGAQPAACVAGGRLCS